MQQVNDVCGNMLCFFTSELGLNHHLNASKICLYLWRRYDLDLLCAIRGVFQERAVIRMVSISLIQQLLWNLSREMHSFHYKLLKGLPISKQIIHIRMIFTMWWFERSCGLQTYRKFHWLSFIVISPLYGIIITFEAVFTVLRFQALKGLYFLLDSVKLRRKR
jgi:hypothetical protein